MPEDGVELGDRRRATKDGAVFGTCALLCEQRTACRGVDDFAHVVAASLSLTFCAMTRDAAAARAIALSFAGDGRRKRLAFRVGVLADLAFARAFISRCCSFSSLAPGSKRTPKTSLYQVPGKDPTASGRDPFGNPKTCTTRVASSSIDHPAMCMYGR